MENKLIRFFPSNGIEGMAFIETFCSQCIHEKFMHTNNHNDMKCEILDNSFLHDRPCLDKDLELNGWEWFQNENFYDWQCRQYKHWDWGNDNDGWNDPPENMPDDPNQLVLFTFDEGLDELLKERKEELVLK